MNEIMRLDQTDRPLRRRLAAIAFLDVVGYARLVALNEEASLRAWSDLRHGLIEPRIVTWRGRVVDRAGDGIFAEFGSALEALHWAIDVQTAADRDDYAAEPIRLRIAVHLADVLDGPDGEVRGDGVNTAARLQAYAEEGGVIVSKAVVDAVQGRIEAVFEDLGSLHLKNLVYPVHAFRLCIARGCTPMVSKWHHPVRLAVATGVVALLSLASVVHWRATPREQAEHLLRQGLAIACPVYPCGREWLQQRALFQQAAAADPAFARPYAEAALTYSSFLASRLSTDTREDARNAADLATRAVALAPDQAYAHFARGEVLRQDPRRLEDALASFLRVVSLEPHNTLARANIGWVLLLLGRPADAEPYLQAVLDADPGNIRAAYWLNRMGLVHLFLGREGHGADYFRRAIARQSATDAMADQGLERTINLAAALALNGEVDAAQQVIDGLRRRYPALSTNNIWTCACSDAPRFRASMAKVREGAILAGVTDVN